MRWEKKEIPTEKFCLHMKNKGRESDLSDVEFQIGKLLLPVMGRLEKCPGSKHFNRPVNKISWGKAEQKKSGKRRNNGQKSD